MERNGSDTRATEWACAQVLLGFYAALDDRRYDDCLSYWTEDGAWLRLGQWLRGRETIAAALAARPSDLCIHHIVSNVHVELLGECARLRALTLVFTHRVDSETAVIAPMSTPLGLWKLKTQMRLLEPAPLIFQHEMIELMKRPRSRDG